MDGENAPLLLAALGGYLLGSVPFGLLLTRLAGLGDIRQIGSGNIGATNVLRTGDKRLAALTLLLDGGKGAAAIAIMTALAGTPAGWIAGIAAVIGHNFPCWLGFRGGKGVATTLGVLLALSWPTGLAVCGVWLLAAVLFHYSSLAALIALASAPVWMLVFADRPRALTAAGLAVLGFIRHHENIGRLLRGQETRIRLKRPSRSEGV